ncbi:MAG: lamin tail domain-containing protein, partial [Bacteroidota bacterium]
LEFHTKPDGASWPNPPWSTFILRKLLENPEFERAFINRFADHLNTSFKKETVHQKIDELHANVEPEIERQLDRWNLKRNVWEKQVKLLYDFSAERPEYVRMHLMDKFETGAQVGVHLHAASGGKMLLNNNVEIQGTFKGVYFENIPIEVEAIPHYGYRFSHWEGMDWKRSTEGIEQPKKLELALDEMPVQLKAVFEKYNHPLSGQVVINEVSANNKKSGDWIEIFNRGKESISLGDWIFTDNKNEFRLPNVVIPPNDYMVICEDSAKFVKVFPETYNMINGLPFGINKHQERLQLFTPDGAMIDSLSYELIPTDSVFTMALLLPHLDNSNIENWSIRRGTGTPNAGNPYFVQSKIRAEQELWMQAGMAISTILVCILLLVVRSRQQKMKAKTLAKPLSNH